MKPENKTIALPASGKTAVIKQYMTAGFYIDLQETPMNKRIEPTITALVLEFDGKSEDVYKRLREELTAKDYMLVEKEIMEVVKAETGEVSMETKKK